MTAHVRPPEAAMCIVCDNGFSGWEWVDTLVSIIAIVIAAKYVVWQVKENARKSIWQQIYREISESNRKLMHAEADVASFVRSTASNYLFLQQGILTSFQDARVQDFSELMSKLNSARSDVFQLLEAYEITSPKLKIFRTAFNVAFRDLQESERKLFDKYLYSMSMDTPNGVVHKPRPGPQQLAELEACSTEMIDRLMTIGSYCYDLNVEAQNLLLGDVFEHRVPQRKPIDPNSLVIRIEDIKTLTYYFENETLWGKEKKEIEDRVRAEQGRKG